MDEQEDWFNVDDEGFQEKLREDKNLVNLFTDKALVVFWKFLGWCKTKKSFILPSFKFILVGIFGIEIKDNKKVIPILKRQLKSFFSNLGLEKELDWETVNELDKAAVIKKDVRLIEGFKMHRLSGHVDLWKTSPFGLDMQAQYKNLAPSSSTSSSSSSSSWPAMGLDLDAAASNLIAASTGGVNWPSLAW
jgi:hypothetical protein